MTNLEWIKSDDKRLEDFLTYSLAVNADTGKAARCTGIPCSLCLFSGSKNSEKPCNASRKEWLNKEHIPLYEKGDIVISKKGKIYLVFREADGNLINDLLVAKDAKSFDLGVGFYISKDKIKRKIGNVFKSTVSGIAYEIVGNYILKEV